MRCDGAVCCRLLTCSWQRPHTAGAREPNIETRNAGPGAGRVPDENDAVNSVLLHVSCCNNYCCNNHRARPGSQAAALSRAGRPGRSGRAAADGPPRDGDGARPPAQERRAVERNFRETSIVLPCILLDLLDLLALLLELKLGATITVGSTTSSTTTARASSSSAARASTTGGTPIG